MTQNRKVEPIIIIHGTFAADSGWYQKGSMFCKQLDRRLEDRHCPARSWAHLSESETVFSWTGENSQTDREQAAIQLRHTLSKLEQQSNISKYHIISHSHGGNVLELCLKHPKSRKFTKIKSVVHIGVPFISTSVGLLKPFLVLFLFVLTILCLLILFPIDTHFDELTYSIMFLILLIPIILLRTMSAPKFSRFRLTDFFQASSKKKYRCYHLISKYDEALAALISAMDTKTNAMKYAKLVIGKFQFLKVPSILPPEINAEASVAAQLDESSWWKNVISKSFLITSLINNYMAATVLFPFTITMHKFKVFAVRAGLRTMSGIALGDDLTIERISSINSSPDHSHSTKIEIPDSVEAVLRTGAEKYSSEVFNRVYQYGPDRNNRNPAAQLVDRVKSSLSDPNLVHCQYYRNEIVIEMIADTISSAEFNQF